MELGVCADPQYGPALADAGFTFIELHVQKDLKSTEDEAAFQAEWARIHTSPIPAPVANCFVPAGLKITGPDADLAKLEAYVEVALSRAARAGMDTIVFGSGGARWIPDGYDRDEAWQQLVAFGKLISPIAAKNGLTIVVEPLNQRECNVLNTVGESGEYVEQVDHPHFKLLLDTYHWLLDNDSYESILRYGPLVRHVHIATAATRLPPGFEPCDFGPFFQALRAIGYDGRISIEGKWDDIGAQAGEAYGHLETLVQEAK